MIRHSGLHGHKSSSWLRRAKFSKHYMSKAVNDISLPLHKALMLIINTCQGGCMTRHTSARIFTCDNRFLHAGIGSKDFFLTEVLFFH